MTKKLKKPEKTALLEFKISLEGTSPLVWRRIAVHDFIELSELHTLIQMSMGWEATHLYRFEIDGRGYSEGEDLEDTNDTSVEGLLFRDVIGTAKTFRYVYDFGDEWEHQIEIVRSLEHDANSNYPVCTGGENACPPEDCGGTQGFAELKEKLAGKDTKARRELLAWLGGFYDPTTFDPNFVNRFLFWSDID